MSYRHKGITRAMNDRLSKSKRFIKQSSHSGIVKPLECETPTPLRVPQVELAESESLEAEIKKEITRSTEENHLKEYCCPDLPSHSVGKQEVKRKLFIKPYTETKQVIFIKPSLSSSSTSTMHKYTCRNQSIKATDVKVDESNRNRNFTKKIGFCCY